MADVYSVYFKDIFNTGYFRMTYLYTGDFSMSDIYFTSCQTYNEQSFPFFLFFDVLCEILTRFPCLVEVHIT